MEEASREVRGETVEVLVDAVDAVANLAGAARKAKGEDVMVQQLQKR